MPWWNSAGHVSIGLGDEAMASSLTGTAPRIRITTRRR
jgi:hypothetical protein